MRFLCGLVLLATSIPGSGSYHVTLWDTEWDITVAGETCTLSRGYSDESELTIPDLEPGDLSIFDSFYVAFRIPGSTGTVGGNTFFAGQVHLIIYTNTRPKLSESQLRIDSVKVNSVELQHLPDNDTAVRYFVAWKPDSEEILAALIEDSDVSLELVLSSGEEKRLVIPTKPHGEFKIWARMLRACADKDAV